MHPLPRVSLTLTIIVLAGCQSVADPPSPSSMRSAPPTLAKGGMTTQVSGSGQITYLGEQRVFAISANLGRDGSVTGQMEVQNRAQDRKFHGSVVCVGTYGNTAFLGVQITGGDDPSFVGTNGILTVVDNGEGAEAPPDRVSLFTYPYSPSTLSAWCAAGFGLAFQQGFLTTYPVEGGNIQIH